tara:strand:- start:79 stop:258 length:180 start_codon:yes stop_codon:yes gene_type:complete
VVEGESVQVKRASSIPLDPFREKERIRDVNERRMGKNNFIRLSEIYRLRFILEPGLKEV